MVIENGTTKRRAQLILQSGIIIHELRSGFIGRIHHVTCLANPLAYGGFTTANWFR
jgi:hypothetical protein